jgi:hypothetical protein
VVRPGRRTAAASGRGSGQSRSPAAGPATGQVQGPVQAGGGQDPDYGQSQSGEPNDRLHRIRRGRFGLGSVAGAAEGAGQEPDQPAGPDAGGEQLQPLGPFISARFTAPRAHNAVVTRYLLRNRAGRDREPRFLGSAGQYGLYRTREPSLKREETSFHGVHEQTKRDSVSHGGISTVVRMQLVSAVEEGVHDVGIARARENLGKVDHTVVCTTRADP